MFKRRTGKTRWGGRATLGALFVGCSLCVVIPYFVGGRVVRRDLDERRHALEERLAARVPFVETVPSPDVDRVPSPDAGGNAEILDALPGLLDSVSTVWWSDEVPLDMWWEEFEAFKDCETEDTVAACLPKLAAFLKQEAALLEELMALARVLPSVELLSDPELQDLLTRRTYSFYRACEMLVAKACFDLAGGDTDKSLEQMTRLVQMTEWWAQIPSCWLVQSGRAWVYDHLFYVAEMVDFSERAAGADVTPLATALAEASEKHWMSPALLVLARDMQAVFREIDAGKAFQDGGRFCAPIFKDSVPVRAWLSAYAAVPFNPWRDLDEAAALDIVLRLAEIMDRPYYETGAARRECIEWLNGLPRSRLTTHLLLSRTTGEGFMRQEARAQTQLRLLALALLVGQQGSTGCFLPEGTDWVEPAMLGPGFEALAIDPLTGSPFSCTWEGGECTIRSEYAEEDLSCHLSMNPHQSLRGRGRES